MVKAASGPPRFGGIIYTESARKVAYFIETINRHRTPLLFVQDVSGFMVGTEAEHSGIIRAGARFVEALWDEAETTLSPLSTVLTTATICLHPLVEWFMRRGVRRGVAVALVLAVWGGVLLVFAVPVLDYTHTSLTAWLLIYGSIATTIVGCLLAWRRIRPTPPPIAEQRRSLRATIDPRRLRLVWLASAVVGLVGFAAFVNAVAGVAEDAALPDYVHALEASTDYLPDDQRALFTSHRASQNGREQILDHYRNPRNHGTLDPNDATFEDSNPLCGDRIRMMNDDRDARQAQRLPRSSASCCSKCAIGAAGRAFAWMPRRMVPVADTEGCPSG